MNDVKIYGVEEILRKLNKLPEKVMKNVVVGAIRASAKPIIEEAKRLVPVRTGRLKKSIGVVKRKSKDKDIVIFSISPRKTKHLNGWYGRFIEDGTSKMAPHPFFRPAYEKEGENTIEFAKKYMRKRIDKELAKL
ncbi:MAG: HK97 gp10 family phage protein [Sulfurimonas sp.]